MIVLAFVIWSGTSLFVTSKADTLASPEEARALTDRVMRQISSGDIVAGLAALKPYSAIPEAEMDTLIGQTELQIPAIAMRFGETKGVEFICEERVGESLLQIVQLQKYEKSPMVWTFVFYKPDDRWLITAFYFHDNVAGLF